MNILAIYAHPDDAEFLASGTMAKWVEEGHEVYAICATDGSMGTKIIGYTREEVAIQRKKELKKAMEVIGGHKPIGFWFPDGFLKNHREDLKEKLAYWIRKLKADRILTLDPWKTYGVHPDHIEAGRIASEAAVFACFPLFFPEQIKEGLEPHQPEEIWYMPPTEHPPNRIVGIRNTFNKKVQSFLCHQSQVEMLADWFVPGADPRRLTDKQKNELAIGVRDLLQMIAASIGEKYNIQLAEAFYVVKCGPGHFDLQETLFETLRKMPEDIEIM
ncbi:MAG: PIG-L deacetylase family protein [Candidatus Hodarchaeota archaeon]